MNEARDPLMERLKAARPRSEEQLAVWETSARKDEILSEILAAEAPPAKGKAGPGSRFSIRLVLVGAAVVLVAAGFLGLEFFRASENRQHAVLPPASAPPTSVKGDSVTVEAALQHLVSYAETIPALRIGLSGPDSENATSLLGEARALTLLTSSESADLRVAAPVSRKQFALWLWRGFGRLLPPSSTSPQLADLAGLSKEEQQAVGGLIQAGVLLLPDNGAFGGDVALTKQEESALIGRLQALLR